MNQRTSALLEAFGFNYSQIVCSFKLEMHSVESVFGDNSSDKTYDVNDQTQRAKVALVKIYHFLSEQLPSDISPEKWLTIPNTDEPFSDENPAKFILDNGFEGVNQTYRYLCDKYWPGTFKEL